MSRSGDLRRWLERHTYPAVAPYYRKFGKNCSPSMLKLLGIADPSYRSDFYTLAQIVEEMASRPGLIVECGVYRGATLLGIAHRLKAMGETRCRLVGFDSFEGFPKPTQEDTLADGMFHPRALRGVFADTTYEELNGKVKALGFENEITLVKGYFENTLSAWSDNSFNVVHLDCDLYSSYMTCLNFFYPRVNSGGYIVFDEYDFSSPVYPGAQKAIDSFLEDKPEQIQRLSEAKNPRYFVIKK